MAQQSRFARHVGAGDNEDLLRFAVEIHIVGNIWLVGRKLFLDNGVAAVFDVDDIRFVDFRTIVFVFTSHLGKGEQTIDLCNNVGIDLNDGDIFYQTFHKRIIKFRLQKDDFFFRTQNFFFVFF